MHLKFSVVPKEGEGLPAAASLRLRASLRRADSTISKHRRGQSGLGSTVNEEMLRGLGLRDPPRAEVLSEALQGPPIQPPGDQLAAMSQVTSRAPTFQDLETYLVKNFIALMG